MRLNFFKNFINAINFFIIEAFLFNRNNKFSSYDNIFIIKIWCRTFIYSLNTLLNNILSSFLFLKT